METSQSVNVNQAAQTGYIPGSGAPQNDTIPMEDNVDSTHPLNVDFIIPKNMQRLMSARLSFKLRAFRSYVKTVNTTTTTAGSLHHHTVPSLSVNSTSSAAGPHVHYWNAPGDGTSSTANPLCINGAGNIVVGGTGSPPAGGQQTSTEHAVAGAGSSLNTAIEAYDGSGHTHSVSGQTTSSSTSGDEGSHTHTVTPTLGYGVFESTVAAGVTVSVDGVDVTSKLGGPFSADETEIDIRPYITQTPGWHTIALQPTGLGRIHAELRLGLFVNANVP